MRPAVFLLAILLGLGTMIQFGSTPVQAVTATAGQLIISEFRYRGPNGANDEFIEIYNASGADLTVDAPGSTGYGIAASDGTTRCVILNGTVIPNRGHFLCVNSVGYSLASYPAGNGTTATGDATFTLNIPENSGIAIFNNSTGGASYSLANRLDAVGSTAEANTVYKEGTGLPTLVGFSIDYSFVRDECGKSGSITTFGACPQNGVPKDTNNNAADFIFVDTNGTSAGAGQRLGAPGPENMSSPIHHSGGLPVSLLDPCVGILSPPNHVRDFTSDPANNSTFGTLDVRRTVTNFTGGNLTRLRFRVIDLTTFPAPSGIADLRPRTSTAVVVTVDRAPCGAGTSNVTVQGTTLEQPPSQPNGGGFNSSMSAGTITLATPLANGASIDLRFLLGIQQTGCFRFGIALEGLPGGGAVDLVEGTTDGGPAANCNADLAVTKTDTPDPVLPGANITYDIAVSNNGPTSAANVLLQDSVPTGTTFVSMTAPPGWVLNTPPVGGTGPITATNPALGTAAAANFTLVVNVNQTAVGPISNTATVSSNTGDPDNLNNTATASTAVVSADLAITKADTPDPVVAGGNLTYTINVTNNGPANVANTVTLTDTIPTGTTFVSFTAPAGWVPATPPVGGIGLVTAIAPTLASGATATFTLVVRVNDATTGSITNTASVASPTADPNSANNTVTATTGSSLSADLAITKADTPDPVVAGGNITYTIEARNNGPSGVTNGVTVSDTIPAGTTFVSFTAPAGWTPATPPVGGTGLVTATTPALASGATATFTLVVRVNDATTGSITNTASVGSPTTDPNPANNTAAATTGSSTSADLSIAKTGSPATVTAGGNITYTIVVRNNGPSNIVNGVTLTDTLPAGTTFVSLTSPAGWTATTPAVGGTGSVSATTAAFANGATATFALVVQVNAGSATTTVSNAASVASATNDPTPGNSTATAATAVSAAPVPTPTPTVTLFVPPVVPQVFQNPAAIQALMGGIGNGTRNATPVPSAQRIPGAGASEPSGSASQQQAVMPLVIRPPSTGDAGLAPQPTFSIFDEDGAQP